MRHKVILLGEPGTGKSTCGLSYPGVEQHVWGSNEEDTAEGFKGRDDILKAVKFNWRNELTDEERLLFSKPDPKEDVLKLHKKRLPIVNKAKARNVAKYIDYLERLGVELKEGKRPDLQTVFVDNFTPLSEDMWVYTEMLHGDDYTEKTSFKLHTDFQNYLSYVIDLLTSLECHTVVSFHVQMVLDEETAAKTSFLEQQKVAHKKEWQPYLMGKYKFRLAGKFTFAFYLYTETSPGQRTKYYAKLEADSNDVGVAKARIQPFEKPGKIFLPQFGFYNMLEEAITKYNKGGK